MKKLMITSLFALCFTGPSWASDISKEFYLQFDKKTFQSPTYDLVDCRTEMVSFNEKNSEAIFTIANVISYETHILYNGDCKKDGYPNLYAADGSTTVVICHANRLCYYLDDEVKSEPAMILMPEGRPYIRMQGTLYRMVFSAQPDEFWTCSR